MSHYNATSAPRKSRLTDADKLHLRIVSKFAFFAVAREDVQTLGLHWFDDNSRWLATGETCGFHPFVSKAGPRILRGFPRYPHGGPVWQIETNGDRSNDPFAFHVAIVRQSQLIMASRLPNWFAIEWLNRYRQVYTSSDPCEFFEAQRKFWHGVWQPELIQLCGEDVLEGGAE
ncbi:hypothetical protein Plim_0990 [Planctopirus limnophila DSM 3776]|uniref:Uncharacterized protein n=1 Tax=Planctopirus limnophila (strain ATCC 43296 / DSM 3776 / IFAM 1008 / Mu 290) TaxID=521674 RepID=D5ST65_PLAL2|nr:hypothetical protein [Planctopirus limnophila]ADG66833.1 hypothetical protein Plim_0990 [Planctopirus limnophila DSM 3776]